MARLSTPRTYDYAGWSDMLRGKDFRKIGHNTFIERDSSGAVGIRLHNTRVVIFRPDGRIMLNSGGYRTVTTKQRMNAVLPAGVGVFQKDFSWYVTVNGQADPIDFYDGIEIDLAAGEVAA